eukprot:TRINITY_DN8825_c0_g1_i1.p1 TRINITY_DN8825_c0_g1~~TRINITY_DN8825_c0_g1_i1.p1  ORF type:complete len:107 (-),score=7.66 TRINITY_DN8825_c0_g1_i1:33-353(-)
MRWLEFFPLEQVFFVRSEDLEANPANIVQKIWTFLGLNPFVLPDSESSKRYNSGSVEWKPKDNEKISYGDLERLQHFFLSHNEKLKHYLGWESDVWKPFNCSEKCI